MGPDFEKKWTELEENAPEVADIMKTFVMSNQTAADFNEMVEFLEDIQYDDNDNGDSDGNGFDDSDDD